MDIQAGVSVVLSGSWNPAACKDVPQIGRLTLNARIAASASASKSEGIDNSTTYQKHQRHVTSCVKAPPICTGSESFYLKHRCND